MDIVLYLCVVWYLCIEDDEPQQNRNRCGLRLLINNCDSRTEDEVRQEFEVCIVSWEAGVFALSTCGASLGNPGPCSLKLSEDRQCPCV